MKDILSMLILMFNKIKNKRKIHFNLNYNLVINFIIAVLIITDTFLLLFSDISYLPSDMINSVNNFDLLVCFVLFCDYMYRLNKAEDKKSFLMDKYNIITIIAMIPVNFFVFRLLRYIKIIPLIYKGLVYFNNFLKETRLNWSLGVLIISISAGTIFFYIFEHGINNHVHNLWDSFMYVMPTVGALGTNYAPKSVEGEVLSVILMITGLLAFGLFTASIASIYIQSNTEDIKENTEKQVSDEEFNKLKSSIANIENDIKELKELLKKNN